MPKLIITTKAGNGRRKDTEYAITDEVANDPMLRAAKISLISAGENRVVNWRIVKE